MAVRFGLQDSSSSHVERTALPLECEAREIRDNRRRTEGAKGPTCGGLKTSQLTESKLAFPLAFYCFDCGEDLFFHLHDVDRILDIRHIFPG